MAVTTKTIIPAYSAIWYFSPIIAYTATGVSTIVDSFDARNYSASPADIEVYIVSTADGTYDYGNHNLIVKKTMAVGETYTFPEMVGQVLIPGDTISILASVDNAISVRASGREIN